MRLAVKTIKTVLSIVITAVAIHSVIAGIHLCKDAYATNWCPNHRAKLWVFTDSRGLPHKGFNVLELVMKNVALSVAVFRINFKTFSGTYLLKFVLLIPGVFFSILHCIFLR